METDSSDNSQKNKSIPEGSHVWDDDLYELHNPPPRWWVYAYWTTIGIAVVYWILYPAWPGITGFSKGVLEWSSKKQFEQEIAEGRALRSSTYALVDSRPLEKINNDSELAPFVKSVGRAIFLTRCSRCHGRVGEGAKKKFPSLIDDEWIHGGSLDNIYKTISEGQKNKMPHHKGKLSNEQILQVAEYVFSLSNSEFNLEKAVKGEEVFNEEDADCYDCHGDDATGDIEIGAPDLTNKTWIYGGTKEEIIESIREGRKGIMPAWEGKLTEAQIKILTVYVKRLSR